LDQVKAPWDAVALVCRKCGKKLGGGFGKKGRQDLSKVLRASLKASGRRRSMHLVPVECLGLCPKDAVSVVGPGAPGHIVVVPAGADAERVIEALSPTPSGLGG